MRQILIAMAATAACLGGANALAEEAAAEPVDAGKIVETVCAACHGEDGNKMLTPETPKLGGQREDYLAKSIEDYRSGARSNPLMSAVAANLKDAEIEALAAYFASQKSELHTLK